MLTRSRTVAFTAGLSIPLMVCSPAEAQPNGSCDPQWLCVGVEKPGTPPDSGKDGGGGNGGGGGGGGGGSGGGGSDDDSRWTCTYTLAVQPPPGSEDWEGASRDDGAFYLVDCLDRETGTRQIRRVFLAEPPTGNGPPPVNPAVLAQRAVDKMLLRGPQIGITPKPGGKGVTGMPVYMWTETGPETYGPNTASAAAGGISVTATAKVSKIVWSMGDGKTVTCTTAGTPYKAEYGKKPSPDCGHRYDKPSSTTGSGTYKVTATSTWSIDWQVTGGAQAGQLTEVRTSSVDINVAEVQVLN